MNILDYLAILGVLVGAAYLVVAIVSVVRARGRRVDPAAVDGQGGRLVLNLMDGAQDEELTSERMRRMAGLCAQFGGRVFGEHLDYSIESVGRLDRMIMAGWGSSSSVENPGEGVIESLGAYLGEVLIRRSRGRWVTSVNDQEPGMILFLPRDEGDESQTVSPFMLIREKLGNLYGYDLAIAYTALEQKLRELKAV